MSDFETDSVISAQPGAQCEVWWPLMLLSASTSDHDWFLEMRHVRLVPTSIVKDFSTIGYPDDNGREAICHSSSDLVFSLGMDTTDIPVIAGKQIAGEVSDGENDEFFDAKESYGRSDNDSITPWDSISYSPPVAPPGPHSSPHSVAPLVASSVALLRVALPQPVNIDQQFLHLLRGPESTCLPQPRTEDTSVPVTPSSPTRGRMIPPFAGR